MASALGESAPRRDSMCAQIHSAQLRTSEPLSCECVCVDCIEGTHCGGAVDERGACRVWTWLRDADEDEDEWNDDDEADELV
jgi:hypothetical protein